jgi:hypothetical protein
MERVLAYNPGLITSRRALLASAFIVPHQGAMASWAGFRLAPFSCIELKALSVLCGPSDKGFKWGGTEGIAVIAGAAGAVLILGIVVWLVARRRQHYGGDMVTMEEQVGDESTEKIEVEKVQVDPYEQPDEYDPNNKSKLFSELTTGEQVLKARVRRRDISDGSALNKRTRTSWLRRALL